MSASTEPVSKDDLHLSLERGPQLQPSAMFKIVVALLMLPLFAAVVWAVCSLPTEPNGLATLVAQQLPRSGVSNPVTAVLLNFRGYDTLLEIAVLLLALASVQFLRQLPAARPYIASTTEPAVVSSPVLKSFVVLIAPVAVLVAGYLLWAGAHAPGGAFQSAAVIAGLGVLLRLTDSENMNWLRGQVLRTIAIAGLAVFVSAAVAFPLLGGAVLEFPEEQAKWYILLIETAATASIAAVLVVLFEAIIGRNVFTGTVTGAR